jgi:hypothetical protein
MFISMVNQRSPLKNLKTLRDPYFWPRSIHTGPPQPNPSGGQVPLKWKVHDDLSDTIFVYAVMMSSRRAWPSCQSFHSMLCNHL